jgi:hypothetical protein
VTVFRGATGIAAAVLALGLAACSPAAAPAPDEARVALQPEAALPVEPAPVEPTRVAPEPVAPAPVVQGVDAQGANMQSGNDHGGQQQAGALDPRLVGTWVNEKQINSGGGAGGFASFSTVMSMLLHADGTVQQYTQSVGGGGEWSSNSGRTLDFEGRWRAANGTLLVHAAGLPDFVPAATYSFSGEYLVTQSDMGRLIWQRR